MKKKILLVMICIALVGCVQASHTSHGGSDAVGYQFDEPQDYCRRIISASKFELYCPDGLIVVEFVETSNSVAEILESQTTIENSEVEYVVQNTAGDASSLVVAELKGNLSKYIEKYPMFVGVGKFNNDVVIIAKGKLYNVRFIDNFGMIFRTVVLSLRPADE